MKKKETMKALKQGDRSRKRCYLDRCLGCKGRCGVEQQCLVQMDLVGLDLLR